MPKSVLFRSRSENCNEAPRCLIGSCRVQITGRRRQQLDLLCKRVLRDGRCAAFRGEHAAEQVRPRRSPVVPKQSATAPLEQVPPPGEPVATTDTGGDNSAVVASTWCWDARSRALPSKTPTRALAANGQRRRATVKIRGPNRQHRRAQPRSQCLSDAPAVRGCRLAQRTARPHQLKARRLNSDDITVSRYSCSIIHDDCTPQTTSSIAPASTSRRTDALTDSARPCDLPKT